MLKVKDLIADTLLIGGGIKSLPLFHQDTEFSSKSNGATVILIPGMLSKWWDMYPLYKDLRRSGHNPTYIKELGLNLQPIAEAASILMTNLSKQNLTDVVVVGHSKGGLIGKFAMSFLDPEQRIRGLISIAAPFQGVPLAKFIPVSSFNELHPGSANISKLKTKSDRDSKIVSIAAEDDGSVGHPRNCYLEGAENIVLPIVGHHRILYDQKTLFLISQKITSF